MKHIIVLICLLLATYKLSAKEEFIIPRMANAPAIDGVISDGEWENATKLDKFYQVIFEDNTEPT